MIRTDVRRCRPHPLAHTPTPMLVGAPRRSRLTRAAVAAGRLAARASRAAGFGGQMIAGRVALVVSPGCLTDLAAARRIVLVSGTNGKTTTTAMVAAALRTAGEVATNATGANMLDGLTTALMTSSARNVVAEIDELYLPEAVAQTSPAALALLNLSRDQLDRTGEIRHTADRLRRLAAECPRLTLIANCDDPYVVYIAEAFARVVWVGAGISRCYDADTCPLCSYRLAVTADPAGADWACRRCGLRRPTPDWQLAPVPQRPEGAQSDARTLIPSEGAPLPLSLRLPGAVNYANAAMAVVTADALGVPPAQAARSLADIRDAAGRYLLVRWHGHDVRLLLAKNPASWATTLDLLAEQDAPVVIAVNAGQADGRDTSWLYDVGFERLAGRTVVACGQRAADLGVRLGYAGVTHVTHPDPLAAVQRLPAGPVTVIADYTSFARLRRRLGEGGHDG
ncbi:MAG: MurT ligase domain-containing protein [Mycobacteriales bacterium]